MVLLSFKENLAHPVLYRQVQATHTAPATTPAIGFLETFLLIGPDQIERVQSIRCQALRIILVNIIFQTQTIFNPENCICRREVEDAVTEDRALATDGFFYIANRKMSNPKPDRLFANFSCRRKRGLIKLEIHLPAYRFVAFNLYTAIEFSPHF